MKIIERHDENEWTARVTCQRCTSVLEVDATDVRVMRASGDPRESDAFYVDCPVCSNLVYVDPSPVVKARLLR